MRMLCYVVSCVTVAKTATHALENFSDSMYMDANSTRVQGLKDMLLAASWAANCNALMGNVTEIALLSLVGLGR